jgi:hypothetical protein
MLQFLEYTRTFLYKQKGVRPGQKQLSMYLLPWVSGGLRASKNIGGPCHSVTVPTLQL